MRWMAMALLCALPVGALAQGEVEVIPLDPAPEQEQQAPQEQWVPTEDALRNRPPAGQREQVTSGTGAVLRALDKLNAKVNDVTLENGSHATTGRIDIELSDCRYPTDDPSGNAYAFLTVREAGVPEPVFRGWMIAASPALNPMDHPRYDVWVLRCTTS